MNIDANALNKIDLWLDVRNGLPFPAKCVDSIYSTHMFEHFYPDELQQLLKECLRVLRPSGGIRLVVPSLQSAIVAYAEERYDWFYDDYPRHFDSLGGRFSNFVFCDGQHRTAFDLGYLEEVSELRGSAMWRNQKRVKVDCIRKMFPLTSREILGSFPIPFTLRPFK